MLLPFLVIGFLIDEGLTIRKHVIMNQISMFLFKKGGIRNDSCQTYPTADL